MMMMTAMTVMIFFLVGFNFIYFRIVGQTKSAILLAIYSQTVQDFQVG